MIYPYYFMLPTMGSNPVYHPSRSMVIKRKIREARKCRGRLKR